ncbi:short-chain dehydrogenase/reductase [Ktedonobacter sp. SOSP1-52]|uniref:SDR family oxidoreductase n=1 Tax=Ktedonobacter sp. SOSP1-52 TaxID=2778366 RepID=UPI001915AABC|nr:SDR family oxidoreductase [Ktedonobacter sp. SOSP1-52]GHO68201.1 short-chain dehydrogenase/reductase [Ktedonobacter sp. SOSP1-52]
MSSQQVVLVTGSKSGFGRNIVETLARQGHRVFASLRDINGRNASYAKELSDFAQREQLALSVLELDVTNETSVNQAVKVVVDQAGRIDVVVNNAGVSYGGITEGYTLDQVRALMEVNFFGPVHVDRTVLPYMRQQRNGLLIHISSISGGLAFPFTALYCASKWALEALAESYHYELAPLGIESILVEPSLFPTEILSSQQTPHDQERLIDYGAINDIAVQTWHAIEAANNSPDAPDPQIVVDVVADLIAQPRGTRPLRTTVGNDLGLASLNAAKAQTQQTVLDAWGLTEPLAFKIPGEVTTER